MYDGSTIPYVGCLRRSPYPSLVVFYTVGFEPISAPTNCKRLSQALLFEHRFKLARDPKSISTDGLPIYTRPSILVLRNNTIWPRFLITSGADERRKPMWVFLE